jgi:hypothetical protein
LNFSHSNFHKGDDSKVIITSYCEDQVGKELEGDKKFG